MTLSIQDLRQEFTTGKGEKILALDGINLEVGDEEIVCILGPSGCGKTTLLRIVAGLDRPTSGTVTVNGKVTTGPDPLLGMIFQDYSLYPWRTVIDNIAFGLEVRGVSKKERMAIAAKYLDLVDLDGFANSHPFELSGGMRQRVAVARALAVEPAVLLMDEPFGALDAQTRNMLQQELLKIWRKTKKIILFVTHSVDEAVFLADRVVVLTARPGQICEIVPIAMDRPRDRTSVEFARIRRSILDRISQKCDTQ